MEAPVPASALIHSATLVSAGVYLLLRFKYLIEIVQLENLLLYIGSLTAAYGGIVSAAQTDVKKLLAYSTISHCGFLFICCALNNDILTITYLYLHGIFKAMSFFCIGTFIRISGSQDSREMGNMSTLLPIDSILLIISSTNLGGIPFSIGFFYKDLFFCTLLNHSVSIINLGFIFIGLLSGAIYTFRLIYYTCFDCKKTEINITIQKIQSSFNNNINN
jgi:NADH:ubiquinone oxidoreductase subunit 5 (subunit L)/multisubunit Na+/H+ antiporter MnhA subunit